MFHKDTPSSSPRPDLKGTSPTRQLVQHSIENIRYITGGYMSLELVRETQAIIEEGE